MGSIPRSAGAFLVALFQKGLSHADTAEEVEKADLLKKQLDNQKAQADILTILTMAVTNPDGTIKGLGYVPLKSQWKRQDLN